MKIEMELEDLLAMLSDTYFGELDVKRAICSIEGKLYGRELYKDKHGLTFAEFNSMCQQERDNARARLARREAAEAEG